jgi:hypothetical protein
MNRFWLRSFVLLFGVVQQFAASNFSQAGERAAEKLLPKDTLAFFTISDVPELTRKWDKTSIGQMLHDPQLKPFLDDVYKAKADWSKDTVESALGVSVDDLFQLPQGDLTFAFLETAARKLAFVVMLEYGSHQDIVDKLLKKLDERLEGTGKEQSTEEIENIKVQIYSDKDRKSKNPIKSIAYFTDKSYFVLSNEVDAIKEVVERWKGNSDDTLAENDQYEYIQTQCKTEGGAPLVKVFLNPIGLIQVGIAAAQTIEPQLGMAATVLPIIGIDEFKGYGGAITFDEGDFEGIANFFIYAEKPRGLLGVFNYPATQLSPPSWVPDSVSSYLVANWDIRGAYSSIETLVDTFLGAGATARQLEELGDQGPMINPKKDVIDYLDGKIHLVTNEPKAADDDDSTPSMFLGLGLKDAAKMKKTLATVAKFEDFNIETREFNGETIYEVNQPDADQTLSMAVTEGNVVFTNDTPMLEGMMRGQSGRRASLADSDEYKRFAKFIPSKTSMLGFQRSDVQLKLGYNLMKKSEQETVPGIDFSKLPPFEVIAKYLLPSASYVVPDKKGAKTVSFTLKRND